MPTTRTPLSLLLPLLVCCVVTTADAAEVSVSPSRVVLGRWGAGSQLTVVTSENGRNVDLTRDVEFDLGPLAGIVSLDDQGFLRAESDGQGELTVRFNSFEQRIPVVVRGVAHPEPIDFEQDVQPILTRFSCNAGACHGKQRGQNGFQLSLLGFDSDFDFDALTKEARGRRTFASVPSASLLMQKPCGDAPHGGGVRIAKGSPAYRMLEQWVSTGAARRFSAAPRVESIHIEPAEVVLARTAEYQLRVVARYSDGSDRDVTQWASFQSSEAPVADVNERGLIRAGSILGDAAVMARFQGLISVCSVLVPHPEPAPATAYEQLPASNFVDHLVWKRLQKLGVTPSESASESTVLRRLYLDLIGRGPTAEEARTYLLDEAADKRVRLIDRLLDDPEYAEHWASKWADLLRPNPYHVGIKATLNYDQWIRESFRANQPYDEFVRDLLTAQGSTFKNGAVTMFRNRRTPEELTTQVSQLFLGIRLECAKCHHHPFEVYGQEDFYSFAAYFAKLGRKGVGISAPISGSEEFFFVSDKGSVQHPLTGETLPPKPLFGTAPEIPEGGDPRAALVAWMTGDENPYFSRAIANRVWADLMGRGLVEPVDDLRGTNPPSNPELLDALAQEIRTHDFDLKHLIRVIANSQVYALSSIPSATNAADHRNFSRHYRQRLRAEVLYDTIAQITGVHENLAAMPPEARAKELWTVRVNSLFLDAFGRQDPNQDPPCERDVQPTIVQALHLMNSDELYRRVASDKGRAAALAQREEPVAGIVEEMYLSVLGRFPNAEEVSAAVSQIPESTEGRRGALEDMMWALINTPEFIFED